MTPDPLFFSIILTASLLVFAWSCRRRLSLVAIGSEENRFDDLPLRLWNMFTLAFGQKKVLARPFGLNHFVIFWSFMLLALANGDFLIRGIAPRAGLALLPPAIYHPLLMVFDLVSLLALLASIVAAIRKVVAPPYEGAATREAFAILGAIALLMLAYFGLHGAEIAAGKEPAAAWMPVSALAGQVISLVFHPSLFPLLSSTFWWLHAVLLLGFINFLPYSKHMHVFTAIPNCFMKSLAKPNAQPREQFAEGNTFGVGSIDRFSWKDLFDSFSCTECGRCQLACPAATTGKALNPRGVIHSLKQNLLANGPLMQRQGKGVVPLIGNGEGSVAADAVWSCTTCGACMAACPVMIEHTPKLVKMRRHLVETEAAFPEELLVFFENMEQRSNPWGIAPGERSKWSSQISARPFKAGETEYLFFVGCAGAFDSRSKQVTLAMARILDAAGVSWGILGKEEKCCGDSVRRLGNEFVFDRIAEENVALFNEKGITRVITHCPHCFSTLKNDYRQYGLELRVISHAEFIDGLLREGKLQLNHQVTGAGAVVFHDSCYLGRHNEVYQAPRSVITAATGEAPLELPRNRENAFCCGAGGGRMWMEEHAGSRINLNRVDEALAKNPDTICVSCPYCMTMMEDALKDRQAAGTCVRDIAEIVAEGLRPDV
ncbi:(Fe-S)-binding protein [Geotalea sp. SG265]|uniref:(Fe-S)-binding protein n=1 Tax=Geotalea sp. SG265 TaxID=2922867 RepID=UPI001FAFA009|nr:(Fe-S)-binding protein [Geotalea sp. SG265]